MKVLVACEESQRVCIAFRNRGHEAYSCDILDCSGGHPEWHIKDDVLKHLDDGFDLMIGHPPCTRLCNSGVRWLNERNLWSDLELAAKFFNDLLAAPIEKISLESPIQHKYARQYIRKPDQIIQPYHFGEPESKATCLWLKNLPPLMASLVHTKVNQSIFKMPPSDLRSKLRSQTFQGIATAMASQWG
jgi:hypothetical protein